MANDFAPRTASSYVDPSYWLATLHLTLPTVGIPSPPWTRNRAGEKGSHTTAVLMAARRDSRFGKEEHYEWCKDFSHFRHLLAPLLSPSLSVLEIGCGNSQLSEELLREGVAGGITCIDLSPVAVERVRDRLADQGIDGVEVVAADMLHLPFRRESLDLVIEKGTMDVLFVDSGSPWNPNRTTVDNVMKMLEASLPSSIF